MGRQLKLLDEKGNEDTMDEQSTSCKTIVRYITRGRIMPDGASIFTGEQVDRYVGSFIDKGYKLITAARLDEAPEGAIGMVYVLAKQ